VWTGYSCPLKRRGSCVRFYRTAGNEKAVPLQSGDLRECRQPKRQAEGDRPTRVLQFPPRSREKDRRSPAEQPTAKPTKRSPTYPPKPPKPGRTVFGSKEHAQRRGIDGPPQDSPPPKAVERSAGWRRTIDSSPVHKQEKESPLPPSWRQVLTRLRRTSPQARNKRLGSHTDRRGGRAPDWPAASDRRSRSR